MESGLFLHQAYSIRQFLLLDVDSPFPQRPPKSPIIDNGMLLVLRMMIYKVEVWSHLIYILKYISIFIWLL